MYKLNRESNAAKFYKWIWGTEVSTFKTMCPYFWKYTLTILFLPLILLGKLLFYLMPAKKKVAKGFEYVAESKVGVATSNVFETIGEQRRVWNIVGKTVKWSYFIIMGGLCLMLVLVLAYKFWLSPLWGFAVIGFITTLALLIGLVLNLFSTYNLKRKITAPFRLFGNMISSLYHNMCPLIQWN